MDHKLVEGFKSTQDSFADAYKIKSLHIQRQMEEMRGRLTEEALKIKKDTAIQQLEKENFWLKDELTKTEMRRKKLVQNNKKLQDELEQALSDRKHLESIVLDLKRKNISRERSLNKPMENSSPRSNILSQDSNTTRRNKREDTKTLNNNSKEDKSANIYQNAIELLKRQLEAEKKKNMKMQAEIVTEKIKETDLKEFFVSCVEEVRKDVMSRRQCTLPNGLTPSPGKGTKARNFPFVSVESFEDRAIIPLSYFKNTDKKYCYLK